MHKSNDKVFIQDLAINMSVGIYDHERKQEQRVVINITMDVENNAHKKINSINDVVSYEDIINSVTEIAQSKHYDLLEEFAEKIATICLDRNKVLSVRLAIGKPDIIKECGMVGIDITRQRN